MLKTISAASGLVLVAAGCGSSGTDVDAAPDGLVNTAQVGPVVSLPLLDGYNHGNEVAVAAYDNVIVVAAINLILESQDSFLPGPSTGFRRVAAYVSTDLGLTFGAPVPIATGTSDSTDPVVQVDAAGTFWLAALDGSASYNAFLYSSNDPSAGWNPVPADLPVGDKPWLAVTGDAVFVNGVRATIMVGLDGSIVARHDVDPATEVARNTVSGYADASGTAHFLTFKPEVFSWDGVGDPVISIALPALEESSNTWTRSGGSMGSTASGLQWLVRSLRTDAGAPIVLRVREATVGAVGEEVSMTPENGVAFLPAAATDEAGRLHVIWYDTTGPAGVLRYTRSVSSDFADGFLPSIVVDEDACPGNRWYPYSSSDPLRPPGGRRLREYIGIAVVGTRAYVAWTHAPVAPSLVRFAYIEFE